MSTEDPNLEKYLDAARKAAQAARNKTAEQRREEEAERAEGRLRTLARLSKNEYETQIRLRHERYRG